MSEEEKDNIVGAIDDTPAETPADVPAEGPVEPAEAQVSDEAAEDAPKKGKRKKEKKKLTPEQKKKRLKRGLIIAGSIILALAIFFSGIAIGNVVVSKGLIEQAGEFEPVKYVDHEQLKPSADRDESGWRYFVLPEGREEFKVLQLTDVHIGGGSFSKNKDTWAMNAVATMIRNEQPDLVVVTGDIAYPVPFQAGTFNNLNATKIFANMMESLQVYWTFAFGNHDTEAYSMYGRDQITKFYEDSNFEYCLFERGDCYDEVDKFDKIDKGFGNHIINVHNAEGKVIQSLVMLDSHSYIDGDYFGIAWKYDNLHDSQVKWYGEQMDKIKDMNGDGHYANNLAFFHIPLPEYREAWRAIREVYGDKEPEKLATATAKAANTESKEDGLVTYHYGKMGETPSVRHGVESYGIFCGYKTDQFFEAGLEHGLKGVFCGHDHYNNFSVDYKGIRLTYGMSVDYLAYPGIYKEHSQRGCTVITVSKDGAFDCSPRNYYEDYSVKHEKD